MQDMYLEKPPVADPIALASPWRTPPPRAPSGAENGP